MVAMSFRAVPEKTGKLIIHIENYFGSHRLALDTATYTTGIGEHMTVTNFKYYISNLSLQSADTKTALQMQNSYLINQADESSWAIDMNDIPEGNYSSINFIIGVDSLHNCSGAQSGALDPINGMFWTWNTGYVFLKLEGKSPDSKSPGHIYEYHIGGYKEPHNMIRSVELSPDSGMIKVKEGKTTQIYIKANALGVVQGETLINIAKLSSVTDFHHADEIADNYMFMFRFIRMSNEW